MVGSVQLPVLVVGVKLHSVIVDILNERKEINFGKPILKWVFSIGHKRILVQVIYFVIVLGIIHFRNENLNFDVILNEACLVRNEEVGVEYCYIDNEFI